jgi:hypothetical protein
MRLVMDLDRYAGRKKLTRRQNRRGVTVGPQDGSVQRLNIAEGRFTAIGSIVSLSIGARHEQRQQERQKSGHIELLMELKQQVACRLPSQQQVHPLMYQMSASDAGEHFLTIKCRT